MDYAAQNQSRSLGSINGGMAGSPVAQRTLAARLEAAMQTVGYQCNRIEDTLAKVNGTPRAGNTVSAGAEKVAVTAPLAQSVEQAEMLSKRLSELASNLEQVA